MMLDEQELQADLRICGKEKKLVNELVAVMGKDVDDVGTILSKKPTQSMLDGINFSRALAPRKKEQSKKKQVAIAAAAAAAQQHIQAAQLVLPLKTIFTEALRV